MTTCELERSNVSDVSVCVPFTDVDGYQAPPGQPEHSHPYVYCMNNPVNYVDPTGMDWQFPSLMGAMSIRMKLTAMTFVGLGVAWFFRNKIADGLFGRSSNTACMKYATEKFQEPNVAVAFAAGAVTAEDYNAWAKFAGRDNDQVNADMLTDWFNSPDKLRAILDVTLGSPSVPLNTPVGVGQRKIGAYMYWHTFKQSYDWHFITQNADGRWSGQRGATDAIVFTTPHQEERSKKLVGYWILNIPPKP